MSATHSLLSRQIEATLVVILGLVGALLFTFDLFFAHFFLATASYAFISVGLGARLGFLDARFVFFASAAVYSTAGSIDYYVFDDFAGYGEELNARILTIGSEFMFAAAAYLIGAARLADDSRTADWRFGYARSLPVFAVLMVVVYIGFSIRNFGFSIGELDRATLTSEQTTAAALARGFAVALIVVWVWLLWHRVGSIVSAAVAGLVVLGLTAFDLLFFGDRRIVLCMLLALGFIFLNRNKALIWLAPVICFMLLGLIFLAAVRGQPLDAWIGIVSDLEFVAYLTPVNLDFGGFPLVASDVLASSVPTLAQAPNYIDGIVAAIPSALYPSRPPAFSAWYVQTFHADVAAVGGGLASNWVIESVTNFGLAGPVLLGIATAFGLNRLCSSRARWPRLNNAASLASFAFLMRYDLTSFLQLFGGVTLVAIILGRYAAASVGSASRATAVYAEK